MSLRVFVCLSLAQSAIQKIILFDWHLYSYKYGSEIDQSSGRNNMRVRVTAKTVLESGNDTNKTGVMKT